MLICVNCVNALVWFLSECVYFVEKFIVCCLCVYFAISNATMSGKDERHYTAVVYGQPAALRTHTYMCTDTISTEFKNTQIYSHLTMIVWFIAPKATDNFHSDSSESNEQFDRICLLFCT